MILPGEVRAGDIADADTLTLCLQGGGSLQYLLVTSVPEPAIAILIDLSSRSFTSFSAEANRNWGGALIADVQIELDEESLFETSRYDFGPGAMVRRDDQLLVAAQPDSNRFARSASLIPIFDGLPSGIEGETLVFSRWSIVIGEGEDRRVLLSVDSEKSG